MKRCLLLIAVAALLQGCMMDGPTRLETDQCLRQEMFFKCLSMVPKGPEQVRNSNDWDEVVHECGSQAYYLAQRVPSQIKEECR